MSVRYHSYIIRFRLVREPTFEKLLHPLFDLLHLPDALTTTISFVISFIAVTYLHVVLGELAPKSFAIQHTEQLALLYSRPLYYFGNIMKPLIWLMNGSARVIVRMFGFDQTLNRMRCQRKKLKLL